MNLFLQDDMAQVMTKIQTHTIVNAKQTPFLVILSKSVLRSFLHLPFPQPFRFKDLLPPPPTAYQLLRELAKEKVRVTPG